MAPAPVAVNLALDLASVPARAGAETAPAPGRTSERRAARLVAFALGAALALTPYAFALGGPLRLTPDSVTYLALADGFALRGPHQSYPPGYPALLRLAERAGLGNAWGFVAVNVALLAVGVVCVYLLCRRPLGLSAAGSAVVCLALVLARPLLEFTPMVMSEAPYFAVAMLSVLVLSRAEERTARGRAVALLLGTLLAAVAISLRVQGVALIAPVAVVAVGPARLSRVARAARRRPGRAGLVGVLSLAALAVAAVAALRAADYSSDVTYVWRDIHTTGQLMSRVGDEVGTKLGSLGELGSQSMCCGGRVAHHGLGIVGAIGLLALLAAGWSARRRFGAIEAFALATAAVIVVYAGAVPRFWLGALPFMIAYALIGARELWRRGAARIVLTAAAAVYVAGSVAWAVHSISLSLAERSFPGRWSGEIAAPPLLATYRLAFGVERPGDRARVMPVALEELRRYEPLAASHGPARGG